MNEGEVQPKDALHSSLPEKARNEVRKEVEKVRKGKKSEQELKDTLQKNLIDGKGAGERFLETESMIRQGARGSRANDAAEVAVNAVVKAVEAASQGFRVSKTNEGQVLLNKLSTKSIADAETASAINAKLGEYLIGDKQIIISTQPDQKTEFEKAFDTLKSTDNAAAVAVGDSLIEMWNTLGITTQEEARRRFKVEAVENKELKGRTEEQMEEELLKMWERRDEIKKIIDDALKKSVEDPQKIETQKEDRETITNYLYGDTSIPEERVQTAFTHLNIPTELISEYSQLFKILHGVKLRPTPFLTDPEFKRRISEANEVFNISSDKFKEQFLKTGPDGKPLFFDRKTRLEFKKLITKYYNYGLQRIHQDQSTLFQEAERNVQQSAYYFGDLHGIITNASEALKTIFADNKDAQRFFTDMSAAYQARIMSLGRTFHDLPLYARIAESFEKWPEFIGYLFPSQLGEIFDPDDRFMEMVRDEIATYTRRRLVLNGNSYPHDLLSGKYKTEGVRYGFRFTDDIKDIIERRMKALGMWDDNPDKDWMLDRAMVYAPGIGIASLVDVEVRSTSDPVGDFESIDPIMAKISAKHNWALGRGGAGAGLKPAKYLLAMDVELFPEQRGFFQRLLNKKKWVPAEFKKMVDEQTVKYGDKVFEQLFDRGGKYQELLNMVNFATSLISRHGWRMRPIKDELVKRVTNELGGAFHPDESWKTEWKSDMWKQFYDISLRDYGNASLWWFNTSGPSRLDKMMKRLLVDHLHGDENHADVEFEEFNNGEKALEKDFKVFIDNAEKELNYLEIKSMQEYQLRGEAFYRYIRRNPGDFFLLLSQLVPELAKAYKNEGGTFEVHDVFLTEHELHQRYQKGKTELDFEKIEARQSIIRKRWGDKYFDVLRNLNKWMSGEIGTGKRFSDVEDFINTLEEESTTASEKMRNQNNDIDKEIIDLEIRREEFKKRNASKQELDQLDAQILGLRNKKKGRLYITKDDFDSDNPKSLAIADLIFNNGGMINILTGTEFDQLGKENEMGYFEKFGDYNRINTDNFFFQMGQAWTLKNGNVNPFSADFNHYAVYSKLGEPGEDLIKRYIGDAVSQSKVIDKLSHLDHLLLEASHHGNFEEIYKLHSELFMMLQGIISKEYAHRANNILASVVTQFFYEHSATRQSFLKFPFDIPIRAGLEKNISLSKLITGNRHAYTMDENAARTYFRKLSFDLEVIPHEGAWSHEQLDASFDSKDDTFIFGDVIPSVGYFLFMFLVWTYAKKALEEAEGKKH